MDVRIAHAVSFKLRCPEASIPEAMRATKFSVKESSDTTKQMAVRRAYEKAAGARKSVPLAVSVAASRTGRTGSSLSPMTEPTTATTDASAAPRTPEQDDAAIQLKPKRKQIRHTASGMQQRRVNKYDVDDHSKKAFKRATSWYQNEVGKKSKGLSSREIAEKVKVEFDGVGPSATTLQRYINNGIAGQSPLKPGVKSNIPKWAYKSLTVAFESYVRINQLNRRDDVLTLKKLVAKINKAMNHDYRSKLLNRVLLDTAKYLDASKMEYCEDRRIRWTTYSNINIWFDNWEWDLVDLGFAFYDEDGKCVIPDEQLCNILNFDETCLSADGSEGRRGGRPEITIHDPRFPMAGKVTNKDSLTATLICGSNAAGEALPPHFQFQTKATSDERERLRTQVFALSPRVLGKFGTESEREWDITFGLNTKGGMDDREFELYIMNSILPLYPNTLDRPGRRLILKCDSGPGRLQIKLLAKLRHLGVYLYPCVPNTTAVMQETDRTYGKFKSQFRKNLELLVDELVEQEMSIKVPQYKLCLLAFGGEDPDFAETSKLVLPSAFEYGFGREECLKSWRKIGAAPLTRQCLSDPKVARAIGDGDDKYAALLRSIQEANEYAVYALTEGGYKGSALQGLLKAVPEAMTLTAITVRHSSERIMLLAKANTHGKKFYATGGSHVCSDDFFKAEAVRCREDHVREQEALKKKRQQNAQTEVKALAVLDALAVNFENDDYRQVSVKDLTTLLAWYEIPREKMKKADMVARWKEIRVNHTPPPIIERWSDLDEGNLVRLKTAAIDMSETALGRYAALMKRQAVASVLDFTDEEWDSLQKLRKETGTAATKSTGATDETWMDAIEETDELQGDNTDIGGEYEEGAV